MAEMLIVIAIIGVVVAIGYPALQGYIDRSRVLHAKVQVGEVAKGIQAWERKNGRLPASLVEADLVRDDPWGNPLRYLDLRVNPVGMARKDKSAAPINSDFDLYSMGKDGQSALPLNQPVSRDDIVRARDGAFIGIAEEFDP